MHGSTQAPTHDAYIAALDEPRRSDVRMLHELIRTTVPELRPTMEFGMLGYGRYHYRYATGREGDAAVVGLASNKRYISLYVHAPMQSLRDQRIQLCAYGPRPEGSGAL